MIDWRRGLGAIAATLVASGCAATVTRSYAEPLAYTRFAAQEACMTAGFQLTRVDRVEIEGERPIRLGLLAGQGNEQVVVFLVESGAGTTVEITTHKRFFPFLAQRHHDERIAEYLDLFVVENRELEPRLAGAAP